MITLLLKFVNKTNGHYKENMQGVTPVFRNKNSKSMRY